MNPADIAAAIERALLDLPALAATPLPGPVWLVLRDGGRRVASGWREPAPLDAILKSLWCGLDVPFDIIELFAAEARRPVETALPPMALSDERGILGLEARFGDLVERIAPTTMIARNWGFVRAQEQLLQALHTDLSSFRAGGGKFALLSGQQAVAVLDPETGVRVHPVFRGQRTVSPKEVDAARAREVAAGMADWLRRHLQDSGRLIYSWHMSRGKEGVGDNAIRRFMATVALRRIAAWTGAASDAETASRNLAFNFAQTYREDADGVGHIALQGSAKLGAMALAALAALEIGGDNQFTAQRAGLTRGIDALSLPNGRFRTFLYPEGRADDNQNFYSGEALLYWAHLHRHDREALPAERFYHHADHYKVHFRKAPNPAFVPWHTMARCMMLETEAVRNSDSVDFVFAMNDWLLPMQQWETAPYPDLRGRFYDPQRPQFGPPHASSTGVYLEGLVKAWRLARWIGDEKRATTYAVAIRRGIRSLSQLQIRINDAETDLWYVTKRSHAYGGLRTTEWDNRIRVDNVQHGLMALLDLMGVPGDSAALFDSPQASEAEAQAAGSRRARQ